MVRRLTILAAVTALLAVSVAGAAEVELLEDGRTFVRWSEWRAGQGPLALLVWASWAPAGDEVLAGLEALETAAAEGGLRLVVLAVQEPMDDSRTALGDRAVSWLHDRHGALLKELRVIRVPLLVIVEADGRVSDRLEPNAPALRARRRP